MDLAPMKVIYKVLKAGMATIILSSARYKKIRFFEFISRILHLYNPFFDTCVNNAYLQRAISHVRAICIVWMNSSNG